MSDGRIDGHFIVNTNLATSIKNELGLSDTECKQLGRVWEQVLNEANNSSNYEVANKNHKDAVIVDAWIGKSFSVQEGIEYYKEFLRFDEEHKMTFGTREQNIDKLMAQNG